MSEVGFYEKLAYRQRRLKAPKTQYNSFGKYHYRSCEDILEALKAFDDGCFVTLSDELSSGFDRLFIKATATFSDGKDSVFVQAYAEMPSSKKGMDLSQITGAASSYARKYALSGLFCIDDNRDADATNKHDKKDNESEIINSELIEQRKNDLIGLIKKHKDKIPSIVEEKLKKYGVKYSQIGIKSSSLSLDALDDLIDEIDANICSKYVVGENESTN